jgi:hypothetical protein
MITPARTVSFIDLVLMGVLRVLAALVVLVD